MTKSLKLIIGCACALILLAACTDENAYYQTADSAEESKPEVVRTQDHLVRGKVVFHEYVPSDHVYTEYPYHSAIAMHYTNGSRPRLLSIPECESVSRIRRPMSCIRSAMNRASQSQTDLMRQAMSHSAISGSDGRNKHDTPRSNGRNFRSRFPVHVATDKGQKSTVDHSQGAARLSGSAAEPETPLDPVQREASRSARKSPVRRVRKMGVVRKVLRHQKRAQNMGNE